MADNNKMNITLKLPNISLRDRRELKRLSISKIVKNCLKISTNDAKLSSKNIPSEKVQDNLKSKQVRRMSNIAKFIKRNSQRSESTNDSEDSEQNKERLLSFEDERKWISIHNTLIKDVRDKVTHAKRLRFMGFLSPCCLANKATLVVRENRRRIFTFSSERKPLDQPNFDKADACKSPLLNNRKLIQDNLDMFSFTRRKRERYVDQKKDRINCVLNSLSSQFISL